MATQQQQDKAKRFQRPERTVEDLNRICGAAFKKLKIPAHWKFKEYIRVPLNEEEGAEIQSISAVFVDKSTSGFDLKHYRINFHTYSERLSLVEVFFSEIGKAACKCLAMNKTAEQINQFIIDNA